MGYEIAFDLMTILKKNLFDIISQLLPTDPEASWVINLDHDWKAVGDLKIVKG